jgi:uncharacterized protein YoxC
MRYAQDVQKSFAQVSVDVRLLKERATDLETRATALEAEDADLDDRITALEPTTYVVADLPAAASNTAMRTIVTDANATTFHSVVAGGGTDIVPVFSDGTDWRIG